MKNFFVVIWNNLIARIIFLSFIVMIIGFYILKERFSFYNFFNTFGLGQMYDFPSTWDDGFYGYEEDAQKARGYYLKGLQQLIDEGKGLYQNSDEDAYFVKNISPDVSWEKHIRRPFTEIALTILKDIKLFCPSFKEGGSLEEEISKRRDREKKISKKTESKEEFPVIFAKDADELRKWLSSLDRDYFYKALQKKPDFYPAITIREDIFQATCQPLHALALWNKALNYYEYKTEKKYHEISSSLEGASRSEFLDLKVKDELSKSEAYRRLAQAFFSRSLSGSTNLDWQIRNSWENFKINDTTKSLNRFLDIMLKKCRLSGIVECNSIYESLFRLKRTNISLNPTYLYVLAETAFRSERYERAEQLIRQILSYRNGADPLDIKRAERLEKSLNLLK